MNTGDRKSEKIKVQECTLIAAFPHPSPPRKQDMKPKIKEIEVCIKVDTSGRVAIGLNDDACGQCLSGSVTSIKIKLAVALPPVVEVLSAVGIGECDNTQIRRLSLHV